MIGEIIDEKIAITILLAGCVFLSGCGKKTEAASDDNTSEVMQDIEDAKQTESNDLEDELLVSFRKGDKWGARTLDGEVVIEPQYTNRLDFIDGMSLVREDGKFGYINKNNEMVVEPQYDDAREFHLSGM